jgi:hypothetical protein
MDRSIAPQEEAVRLLYVLLHYIFPKNSHQHDTIDIWARNQSRECNENCLCKSYNDSAVPKAPTYEVPIHGEDAETCGLVMNL